MQDNASPRRMQRTRDRRADTPGSAGNQDDRGGKIRAGTHGRQYTG